MLEDVFQPFRQVDVGSARSYGGVGLGLAICKHLVELHGGQIWAEPARPDGTTFRFRVPCDGHPRPPESPVDRASAK
jgi:signal transduction histidine kinase